MPIKKIGKFTHVKQIRSQDEKCEDQSEGYTSFTKCSKWPREVCEVTKKSVKKYTPVTGCTKEPREICAPAGCGFKEGDEVCQDKTQTIVQVTYKFRTSEIFNFNQFQCLQILNSKLN